MACGVLSGPYINIIRSSHRRITELVHQEKRGAFTVTGCVVQSSDGTVTEYASFGIVELDTVDEHVVVGILISPQAEAHGTE